MNSRLKTLFRYVFPSVLSMVSVFLYSIIDGVFVGKGIGSNALGAVNIAFPYVMFFTAFVMMTSIGGLAVIAIRMGREDYEGANEAFRLSFFLTGIIGVIGSAAGMLFTAPIASLLGADEVYLEPVCEYLFWYSVFLFPCGICSMLCGAVRNDGAPAFVSAVTVATTVLNVAGDYLLIFPMKTGLKGAAIATGAAQTAGAAVLLLHFFLKRGKLRFGRVKFSRSLTLKILLRGAPECVSQFSAPMGIMLTNIMLSKLLGPAEINAFSVIGYAASFSAAVFIGVAEGSQPLFGRSYGERNEQNLRFYFRSACIISFAGSVIVSAVIYMLWGNILTVFSVDAATRAGAEYAVLRYMPGFPVQSIVVIINSYLYSTTRTKQALIINVLRSFVLDTAVILVLPLVFGADFIWYTFGIYEGIALIIAAVLVKRADRNGAIGASIE